MSKAEKSLRYYEDVFKLEHKQARDEWLRLCSLFKDVCWYNFETACNGWKYPWRVTNPYSPVSLTGRRFVQRWVRGSLMEHGTFPVWFSGDVKDAPKLPPEIILNELVAAKEYMVACERQISAPYDWAPGGAMYEALLRTTLVGKPPDEQCLRKRKFSH
mgnify:CR=1 FL=1|tara:strand:+ start:337 stop:813 length:477 start_codon:yes stop_codon:yes gene_type:complete